MSIVSLSLPENQIKSLDSLAAEHGFENRSEFMRSLLRFVLSKPDIVSSAKDYPFASPKTHSKAKIIEEFNKTKKYSTEFMNDLEDALNRSSYFTK